MPSAGATPRLPAGGTADAGDIISTGGRGTEDLAPLSDMDRDMRFDLDRSWQHSASNARPGDESRSVVRKRSKHAGLPRIPVRLVQRPGLFRRLDRMAAVTIVEAPQGFGKTTLVASWARGKITAGSYVAWLRGAPDLGDTSVLLHRLRDELLRSETLHRGVPGPRRPADEITWIDDLAAAPAPVIVVIDDAHLVREPESADVLLDLVARTHSVHVVIAAGADHHFHRAAIDHGLETNLISATDLSVGARDLPEHAATWGHHLDVRSATLLHDLVGGWLLPLRLVLDATPPGSPRFATHVADEFLLNRVFPDITGADELARAMRLAVPDHLDADLATALLADDESHEIVPSAGLRATVELERRGLLWRIPRHDGTAQWRFPRLVRRALREQLEQTLPDAARAAHAAVARTLESRAQQPGNALLRHARAAEEWSLLARLWEQHGWSLAGADPKAFAFAYAGIPEVVRAELDSLDLAAALGDGLAGTVDDTDWVQRVEAALRQYMQAGTDFLLASRRSTGPARLAEMLTAAMMARRNEGELHDALRLAGDADREFTRARLSAPPQVRTSQEAWFHLQSAITHMSGGHYSAALELATTAYQISPSSLVGSGASALVAAMHSISGQSADGLYWLGVHESIDISAHWASGLAQLPARLARAMLALDRLDGPAAELHLQGTALGADVSGLWPLVLTVHTRYALMVGDPVSMLPRLDHLGRVLSRHLRKDDGIGRQVFDRCSIELTLALGEVNRVQSRLGDGNEVPAWLVAPAARFHLMTGDARRASRIAAAGSWRPDIHVRDRLQLLVIGALAFRELGRHDRCLEGIRHAHALTKDTGNLEPFRLIPPEVRIELLTQAGLGFDEETHARLNAMRELYPAHAELIQLSPRELEVLRQIPHHDTASGLARTLSVSVNTVRKQLVSLYAKLGVHDRSSALLRARRLGFLADQTEDDDGA